MIKYPHDNLVENIILSLIHTDKIMATIIAFGDWIVDEDGISQESSDYNIGKDQLFDWIYYEHTGPAIWEWLIHIVKNSLVSKETVKDFNTAFVFAQDYFKNLKLNMVNLDHVSLAQSLYIQKQLIEIDYKSNSTFENGIFVPNKESILRNKQLTNDIKYLTPTI